MLLQVYLFQLLIVVSIREDEHVEAGVRCWEASSLSTSPTHLYDTVNKELKLVHKLLVGVV